MHAGLLGACLVVGTAWHEVVGHGLVAVALGGRIERVSILFLDVYPKVEFIGWTGHYGSCGTGGVQAWWGRRCVSLGGSMSTWCVAVVAVALLWCRRWHAGPRLILTYLGIWWIDLLTYTMPTWGLRRSVIWGGRHSEPHAAATALGVPSWAFQVFVVASSVVLLAAMILALRRGRAVKVSKPS